MNDLNELFKEHREISQKFYYNVSILAGSAIVLSVTYLGHVLGLESIVIKKLCLLYLAWVFLLSALLAALLRNFFVGNYVYYTGMVDYIKALKKSGIKKDGNDPTQFLNESQDIQNTRKERYRRLFNWCGPVSLVALVSGLVVLLVFVIINTGVRVPS